MPEYIDSPGGKVRIPDALVEPTYGEHVFAFPRGSEVDVMIVRGDFVDESDDAQFEVVARVFMPRENFENIVGALAHAVGFWRQQGI